MDTAVLLLRILAENVRQIRLQLSLSQEELAHRVGVDVRYLGRIERAQANPSLKVIANLSDALGITVGDLLRLQA